MKDKTLKKMKNIFKKDSIINFTKFVIVPIILILICIRLFVVRTSERELFFSSQAVINRPEISVGSEGYGTVSDIRVNVGDYVNKGDILYKYNNSALDEQIFEYQEKRVKINLDNPSEPQVSLNPFNNTLDFYVRAKANGYVKKVNVTVGDYVTKDSVPILMEAADTNIIADVKVPPDHVERISAGQTAFITLQNGTRVVGTVTSVNPGYDSLNNLLRVNININNKELANIDLSSIYSGSAVSVVVKSSDSFTQSIKSFVNNIKFDLIKNFLTYEY